MRAVIIGMGEVGKYIAAVLTDEKHDVTIVDVDAANLAKAEEKVDALALQGHGASMRTLRQANVDGADLLIAVTNRDEINLLAALMARQLGARRTVARVTNRAYLADDDRGYYHHLLGIDLIVSTQILVANEIHKLIKSFGAVAVENFADNQIELVEIPVTDEARAAGQPIRDLKLPEAASWPRCCATNRSSSPAAPTWCSPATKSFSSAKSSSCARPSNSSAPAGSAAPTKSSSSAAATSATPSPACSNANASTWCSSTRRANAAKNWPTCSTAPSSSTATAPT